MARDLIAKTIFITVDVLVVLASIWLAVWLRDYNDMLFTKPHAMSFNAYLSFYPLYIIPLALFIYEGVYKFRYDFWHESRLILRSILLSGLLLFAYLGATHLAEDYSRFVVVASLLWMAFLVPLAKNILKKRLYSIGLWRKYAKIYGDDDFLRQEIYGNPYLGYIQPLTSEQADTIFINPKKHNPLVLQEILDTQMQKRKEVIFIPLIDQYDLTHSHIYQLSNTRTNLVILHNQLKSRSKLFVKKVTDFLLSIAILPIVIPVMIAIALLLKYKEPKESILFRQKRLGRRGKEFVCYKFRTMHEASHAILQEYLEANPDEVEYYKIYHKYRNDPRITPIGSFLRKTSLDELPQIINVLKREMSLIGPRPYMLSEEELLGDEGDTILAVRPGITGLWQVSGRNDVDFKGRKELDSWYIRNWNLWMDLVILLKTFKVALYGRGAK